MKLQEGERVILELRRSRVTLVWPFLKGLIAGSLAFLYFWGLVWVTYDLTQTRSGSIFADKRVMAVSILGVTLILYLMAVIVLRVRRRRKVREAPETATPIEEMELTEGMPERAMRKIVCRRIARNFLAERVLTSILVLAILALLLFAVEIGTKLQPAYYAAIVLGAVVLLSIWSYSYFCWRNTRYCLTDRRLVTLYGWFSRNEWEIPLAECRHIEGKRNLFDKLFRYGHLTIAGVGTIGKYLAFVPRPDQFRAALQDVLQAASSSSLEPSAQPAAEPSPPEPPAQPEESPQEPDVPEPPETSAAEESEPDANPEWEEDTNKPDSP